MMSRLLTPLQGSSRALAGTDPFGEFHREMNRLFDHFLTGELLPGPNQRVAMPRLDVKESAQEVCVRAELAGVQPSDVELRIEGNLLMLRGEKRDESEREQGDFHVMERSFGRFQRAVQLPYGPGPGQVKAQFDNGVLTIHIPKQPQQERSHRIRIESEAAPQEEPTRMATPAGGTDAPKLQAAPAVATTGRSGGAGMSHH